MIEVVLYRKDPVEVMTIVREMREMGWVQGKDFDFAYKPPRHDTDILFTEITPKYTVFKFYTEKYATLFSLKYATS